MISEVASNLGEVPD